MDVTAEVVGETTAELSLADDATYADVCREVGYSPHEVTVLVDGSPVPEDRAVDAARVKVLRLIKGG
ncbi:ubiquitin-like small modifier protein SAMP2 [Halobaculum sp. D14]|uniref:ubiquitin-like small modifier protein SAMP2 n=1 Tax=unclassified Halobaculum TaxID=2640896 RepID=UPI003EBFE236